jgi:Ca2+ transporting ATPase
VTSQLIKFEVPWMECIEIIVFVFTSLVVYSVISFKAVREVERSKEEEEAAKRITITRNGKIIDSLGPGDVLVGDLVTIEAGMEVPCDGILVNGSALQLDESAVTGETKKMVKKSIDDCLLEKNNIEKSARESRIGNHEISSPVILSGSKVAHGIGSMIAINVGRNSANGKVRETLELQKSERTPFEERIRKIETIQEVFVAVFIVLFFMIAFTLVGYSSIVKMRKDKYAYKDKEYLRIKYDEPTGLKNVKLIEIMYICFNFFSLSGVLIAFIRSLANYLKNLRQNKTLIRKRQVCEITGGVDIICCEKTGTLTKNEKSWTSFWNLKEYRLIDSERAILLQMREFVETETMAMLVDVLTHSCSLVDAEERKGDPTDLALLGYLDECGIEFAQERKFTHNIFCTHLSFDRRRTFTIVRRRDGRTFAFIKGSGEQIVEASSHFHSTADGVVEDLSKDLRRCIEEGNQGLAKQGLSLIGLAYKEVFVDELDLTNTDKSGVYEFEKSGFVFIGLCGIEDPIKEEVPSRITICQKAGIEVRMITGDSKSTAAEIARRVGIINHHNEQTALVMDGAEFQRIIRGIVCDECNGAICDCNKGETDGKGSRTPNRKTPRERISNKAEIDNILKDLAVLACARPEDKRALVDCLRERGNVVAVIGDSGSNACTLGRADVGLAMGSTRSDAKKQAVSILAFDDCFSSFIQSVKWGAKYL